MANIYLYGLQYTLSSTIKVIFPKYGSNVLDITTTINAIS